ncbi:MAG TPA: 16S rRNA (cytosine(967)-C(5))-methyltransferase RsmB [Methylophilaceae bacterium]|nr:16S rRNA (cytosine(967)-C(5))-methyltransferase RsmB [Methylophilaceae bacterium]
MQKAQQLAAQAIKQVLAGSNLTVVLESIFRDEATSLTPQQRATVQDLSYGTLRFYGQLQALLDRLLEKPLKDKPLHMLLLVALYQLQHGKTSPHTVVDQAVKAAAAINRNSWARGLVNAVLRNFLRRQKALLDEIAESEVARYSYPQWWINKLKSQYPDGWQSMLLAGNAHPPMTLRVNSRQNSAEAYVQQLHEQALPARLLGQQAVMLEKPSPVDRIPGFYEGRVSVQDYGAQLAGQLLNVHNGMRVLDACCAPGGKTGHLLELADVGLLGLDSDSQRLQRVQQNLERLGLRAQLAAGDAATPDGWWDGRPFQRILADVPCTASGIVRRHVDIKWLRRQSDIASFAGQQAAILRALWPLLAKDGKLLYVTCSVFHEENQQQIDRFLETHADARQLPLPALPDNYQQQDGQLRPCADHDGFFYAVLQKA